jgi:hypothetical protein
MYYNKIKIYNYINSLNLTINFLKKSFIKISTNFIKKRKIKNISLLF